MAASSLDSTLCMHDGTASQQGLYNVHHPALIHPATLPQHPTTCLHTARTALAARQRARMACTLAARAVLRSLLTPKQPASRAQAPASTRRLRDPHHLCPYTQNPPLRHCGAAVDTRAHVWARNRALSLPDLSTCPSGAPATLYLSAAPAPWHARHKSPAQRPTHRRSYPAAPHHLPS